MHVSRQRERTVVSKDVLTVSALGALVDTHVLHDAEHRHVNLPEHLGAFASIQERNVLGCRDDDGTCAGTD